MMCVAVSKKPSLIMCAVKPFVFMVQQRLWGVFLVLLCGHRSLQRILFNYLLATMGSL
jgi:hypothetical protein